MAADQDQFSAKPDEFAPDEFTHPTNLRRDSIVQVSMRRRAVPPHPLLVSTSIRVLEDKHCVHPENDAVHQIQCRVPQRNFVLMKYSDTFYLKQVLADVRGKKSSNGPV